MSKHFELTDDEFVQQFIDCKLDPTVFNHDAHLRLAWINIKKYGVDQALENIQTQLVNFVKSVGAADKYHETLTVVGVRAVHHFMQRAKSDDFADFIAEFPRLKTDFKGLIASHYSFNIFSSNEARKKFVEPDLLPFQ